MSHILSRLQLPNLYSENLMLTWLSIDPDQTSCSFLKSSNEAVTNRSCDHLHGNGLFEELRSGYKVHHSSEAVLVKVTNDILIAAERGSASILDLSDLSVAFEPLG